MKNVLLALLITAGFNASAQTPQLVANINPGSSNGAPKALTLFNGKLFFTAYEPTTGQELYSYDGVNPPMLVYNINPGAGSSFYGVYDEFMGVLNGKIYFAGNNGTNGSELMSYDGINPPALVQDLNVGNPDSNPRYMLGSNGKLFFNAYKGTTGFEFYAYDGINTPLLFDVNPGASAGSSNRMTEYNGKIYLSANNGVTGNELYQYNPTNNTVTLVEDIFAGAGYSNPYVMTVYNGKLYFLAITATYGRELYSYDGVSVLRLTDVAAGADDGATGYQIIGYNGYIYFSGTATGTNPQLYKYNISNSTTSLVYNINPTGSANVSHFIAYGNKIYFGANNGVNGEELWVHDGNSTSMVQDLNPGAIGNQTDNMIVYNNVLYFLAEDGLNGLELFSLTDPAAGIKSILLNGNVSIIPNPTTDDAALQLSLKQEYKLNIHLTDATGKLVWEKESTHYPAGNTDITIPLSEQAAGIYLYSIKNEEGKIMASGKIQKQ